RGYFREGIGRSAWALQQRQEAGEQVVVGVNRFTEEEPPPALEAPDFEALAGRQRERLAAARAARDAGAVARALDGVRAAAAGTGPMLEPIVAAVRARATLGEVSDALREVWGTYDRAGA